MDRAEPEIEPSQHDRGRRRLPDLDGLRHVLHGLVAALHRAIEVRSQLINLQGIVERQS